MSSSPAPWPGVIGSYTLYLTGIAKKKGKECPSDPEERHKLLLETAQGKSAKQEDLTTYKEEVEDAGANFNAETSGRQLTLTMTRLVGYKKDIIGALRNTIKEELPRLLPASDGKETLEEYKKNSVRVSIKKYGQGFSRNQFIEKFHGKRCIKRGYC